MSGILTNNKTEALDYTIVHRRRVRKRLHLELDRQGRLLVVAPVHWSHKHIDAAMAQNSARISRFMARARKQYLEPLQYVDGEQHLFLGDRYSLVTCPVHDQAPVIRIERAAIHIRTRRPGATAVKAGLQNWYRQQALKIFNERKQVLCQKALWTQGVHIPLELRRMKRTWGNCSSRGLIRMNTHLIKAPVQLIDSVIAHELCHLEEMNHGKAFYTLLESLNPNWKQDRDILRATGFVYLHE